MTRDEAIAEITSAARQLDAKAREILGVPLSGLCAPIQLGGQDTGVTLPVEALAALIEAAE